MEKETKRREPIYYKKYSALKSVKEAKNLLEQITNRRQGIRNMEILVYKKYVSMRHDFDIKEKATRKESPQVPLKPNFEQIFHTIRDRMTFNPDFHSPWPIASSNTTETSVTNSPTSAGQISANTVDPFLDPFTLSPSEFDENEIFAID